MCSCVKLLIYSMYSVKLRMQDNQICSGLLWNTRRSCSQRERGEERPPYLVRSDALELTSLVGFLRRASSAGSVSLLFSCP